MNPFSSAVIAFVKQYIEAHKCSVFGDGDGHSEWKEAHCPSRWHVAYSTGTGGFRVKCTVMEAEHCGSMMMPSAFCFLFGLNE